MSLPVRADTGVTFESLYATTRANYQKPLQDLIMKSNPVLALFTGKEPWSGANEDAMKTYPGVNVRVDGGSRIEVPVQYGENTTVSAFSGYQPLDMTPQEGMTTALYMPKQYGGSINISGKEIRENAGASRMISLLDSKMQQAVTSLQNFVAKDIVSGNTDSALGISGLDGLLSDTGIVGGIDRSLPQNAWWKVSTNPSGGSFAASGLDMMSTAFNNASKFGKKPNVIVTTQALFEAYEKRATPTLRADMSGSAKLLADLGFLGLSYKGCPIVFDDNVAAGTMYFVNTDYLSLEVYNGGFFEMGEMVSGTATGQDAKRALIQFHGEFCLKNPKMHSVIRGFTA